MQAVRVDSLCETGVGVGCHGVGTPGRLTELESQALFLEVVPPHLDNAYTLARSLTRNHADAQDIVQEACLRALRGIGRFEGGSARAWVLTIVRHIAYDWLRKSRRAPELVEDLDSLIESMTGREEGVTPDSELESQQDAEQVERAVQSLSEPFQKALVLRYEQGLTYLEIAAVVGVPKGTVMSRLARARRQIGAIMEGMVVQ
jgi:RNA polymerase sigma-70 factor (ECF subfamily)